MRRKISRTIRYSALGFLAILLLCLIYLTVHGFPDSMARAMLARLDMPEYAVTFDSIKLGILEGIIATDVQVYRKGRIGPPLLSAEKVIVELRPGSWIEGRNVVFGAAISRGTVRLVAAEDTGLTDTRLTGRKRRVLLFNNVEGVIEIEKTRAIRLVSFNADVADIQIAGKGLVLPGTGKQTQPRQTSLPMHGEAGAAEQSAGRKELAISTFLKFFDSIKFDNPPVITIDFVADPDNVTNLELSVSAEGGGVCFEKNTMDYFRIDADFRGTQADGRLETRGVRCLKASIDELSMWFTLSDGILNIRDLSALVGKGKQKGPMQFAGVYNLKTRHYGGRIRSEFDPNALVRTLLQIGLDNQANGIDDFAFKLDPPHGEAIMTGRVGKGSWFRLVGVGQMENVEYCEVPVETARAAMYFDFSNTNSMMYFSPLEVIREEGAAHGSLMCDYRRELISFNCESSLHPPAVARMIGPFMERIVNNFRFEGPVTVSGSGTVGYRDMEKTDLEVAVHGENMGAMMFLAEECNMTLRGVGETLDVIDLEGTLCGGPFEGRISVYTVLGYSNLYYHAYGVVDDADFEALLNQMGSAGETVDGGEISAGVNVQGFIGDGMGKTAVGDGWVKVSEGEIFRLPLFGGLSEIMTRYIPGLRLLLRQTVARASFDIADCKVHTEDASVEGDVFSLNARGDCHFNRDLDFRVDVTLMRGHTAVSKYIVRPLTRLLTKVFEVRLTGTVSDPTWSYVHSPREWFSRGE